MQIAHAQGADYAVTLCNTPAKSVEERQFPVQQLALPGREVHRPQPGQADLAKEIANVPPPRNS